MLVCFHMVGAQGFEPWTPGLKVRCSSQLSYTPILVPRVRLELTTSGLRVRCATNCATKGWFVIDFLLRANLDQYGIKIDTTVYQCVS